MNYYIGLVPFNSDCLEHHGVKGQKHGLRKYQYEDGSLTPAGREHYGVGGPRKKGSKSSIPSGGTGKRKAGGSVSGSKAATKEQQAKQGKEKKKPGRIRNWMSNYGGAAVTEAKIFGKTLGLVSLGVAAGVATQNPMVTKVGLAAAAAYGGISAHIAETKYEANKYSILTENKKVFEYKKKKK